MTTAAASPALLGHTVPPPRAAAWSTFGALLARDLRVLRRDFLLLVVGTVLQPLLFVFVFTYVMPKIGLAVGGAAGAATFSTLLVAGVVGLAIFMQGIQAVTVNLAIEFGYTREIEDRVMAPVPVWAVAVEKILSGAVQAIVAGIVVFPVSVVIPATPVHLHPDWAVLMTMLPLAALLSASFGLAVGTIVDPGKIQFAFGAIVLPVTFLGAVYYPWAALAPIPWLKALVLADPLVYVSEGLRAGLSGEIPHMNLIAVYAASIAGTAVLAIVGIRGFDRRVVS